MLYTGSPAFFTSSPFLESLLGHPSGCFAGAEDRPFEFLFRVPFISSGNPANLGRSPTTCYGSRVFSPEADWFCSYPCGRFSVAVVSSRGMRRGLESGAPASLIFFVPLTFRFSSGTPAVDGGLGHPPPRRSFYFLEVFSSYLVFYSPVTVPPYPPSLLGSGFITPRVFDLSVSWKQFCPVEVLG